MLAQFEVAGGCGRRHGHRLGRGGEGRSGAHGPGRLRGCGQGSFRLTTLGRSLLRDEPGSVAGLASFRGFELHAWAEAPCTLRTAQPSFPEHFGQGLWERLASNPAVAARFNDAMRRRTESLLDVALERFDWPHDGTVVDVGGGNGLLLQRLLSWRPGLRGVVFDLPHVVEEAEQMLTAGGPADRVESVRGSFCETIPAGHDLYVMASVLHGWNDRDATRILASTRRAMTHRPGWCCSNRSFSPTTSPTLPS